MHLTHSQQAIMLLYDVLNTGAVRQPLQSDFDDLDIRLIVGQQKEWKPCEIASSDTTSRFVVGSRLAGPLRLSAGPWPLLERRRARRGFEGILAFNKSPH